MKLRLIGQANHTGIGTHFAGFLRALRLARSDLSIDLTDPYDLSSVRAAIQISDDQDVNICWTAHSIPGLRGRMIQWIPFETTRIPDYIAGPLREADEIWTMTDWGAGVLRDNGFDRVAVMPQGVDQYPAAEPVHRDCVRYLMVAKYEQRKGILEALQAWSQSLINDPRYRLVIKTHGTNGDQGYADLMGKIRHLGIENYEVYWGVMSEADVLALYQRCQIFLAPAYAEGWGRPIMEAAAMGLPIISTDWSAHGEWLRTISDSVLWVDHDVIPVSDRDYELAYGSQTDWGVWARPKVDSIAEQIRYTASHLSDLTLTAQNNRQVVMDRFSWPRVVDQVMARLGLA